MRTVWKITTMAGAVIAISAAGPALLHAVHGVGVSNLTGVVLVDDADIGRQRPIANVRIDGPGNGSTVTDASGLFHLQLPPSAFLTRIAPNGVPLNLQHPDFIPLHRDVAINGQLYVLRMKPISTGKTGATAEIPVSDIRVRYTESTRTSTDTGSVLKSFDVVNTGNVPCNGHQPCSPDGKWKAAIGGASLDAGEDNEFREARMSCIAGPCPFTRIEKVGFSRSSRQISVTVRDWSDTVSFVLEAEVTRNTLTDLIRLSYPLVFGRALNFSLPPSGEGPSIEASVGGEEIVYPLGPGLNLSWTECSVQTAKDHTKDYRCDLKPGYRFQ